MCCSFNIRITVKSKQIKEEVSYTAILTGGKEVNILSISPAPVGKKQSNLLPGAGHSRRCGRVRKLVRLSHRRKSLRQKPQTGNGFANRQ